MKSSLWHIDKKQVAHYELENQKVQNSLYPDAINSWNIIGPELRQTDKLSTF